MSLSLFVMIKYSLRKKNFSSYVYGIYLLFSLILTTAFIFFQFLLDEVDARKKI